MRKALIIGVGREQEGDRRSDPYGPSLVQPSCSLADARQVARLLSSMGRFDRVQLLLNGLEVNADDSSTNREPGNGSAYDAGSIRGLIEDLFQVKGAVDTDAMALLFFSGSGGGVYGAENVERGDLLLPGFGSGESFTIPLQWLAQCIRSSPVPRLLVWLDSDFANGLVGMLKQDSSELTSSRGLCLLTARPGAGGYADENDRHGVFTEALLACLNPLRQLNAPVTARTLAEEMIRRFQWPPECQLVRGAEITLTHSGVRGQKLWNDLAEGADLLGVRSEAEALADLLLLKELKPPLAVGILGGWGSGKSTIMHLMRQRMIRIRSLPSADAEFPYVGHVYLIHFDAWTYSHADIWVSLMNTIFRELSAQIGLEQQLEAFLQQQQQQKQLKPDEVVRLWQQLWAVLDGATPEQRQFLLKQVLSPELMDKLRECANEKDIQARLKRASILIWGRYRESREQTREKVNELEKQLQATDRQLQKNQQLQEQLMAGQRSDRLSFREVLILGSSLFASIITTPMSTDDAAQKAMADGLNQLGKVLGPGTVKRLREQRPGKAGGRDLSLISVDKLWIYLAAPMLRTWLGKEWRNVLLFLLLLCFSFLLPQLVTGLDPFAWLKRLLLLLVPFVPALKYVRKLWSEAERIRQSTASALRELADCHQKELDMEQKSLVTLMDDKQEAIRRMKQSFPGEELAEGLRDFIESRQHDYDGRMGTMHEVQRDLASLSQRLLLRSSGDLPAAAGLPAQSGEHREQQVLLREIFPRGDARVVLFIDDLDRCPPSQVVKMLEAMQLLVRTPLFIAVLAIDERYVTRALEQHYKGVLERGGQPSGIDYLEKIIQIPYRVRPVARTALRGYLEAQMEVEPEHTFGSSEPGESSVSGGGDGIPLAGSAPASALTADISDTLGGSFNLRLETLRFRRDELEALHACCRRIPLTPRMIKRLINIVKIYKIAEYHASRIGRSGASQTPAILAMLALSARYPDSMREMFESLELKFEELEMLREELEKLQEERVRAAPSTQQTVVDGDLNRVQALVDGILAQQLVNFLPRLDDASATNHHRLEAQRLKNDATALLGTISLTVFDQDLFELVRSFCFFAEVGYSPGD